MKNEDYHFPIIPEANWFWQIYHVRILFHFFFISMCYGLQSLSKFLFFKIFLFALIELIFINNIHIRCEVMIQILANVYSHGFIYIKTIYFKKYYLQYLMCSSNNYFLFNCYFFLFFFSCLSCFSSTPHMKHENSNVQVIVLVLDT